MSTDDRIMFGLSLVVGGTGGKDSWTEESVRIYHQQFASINDPAAFVKACEAVVATWDQTAKPPAKFIHEAYKAEIARRHLDEVVPAQIEEGGRDIPEWRDGVEIARRAYYAECLRRGKEPNDHRFESVLAKSIGRGGSFR